MKIDSFIEIRKKSIKNLLIITTVSLFFLQIFKIITTITPVIAVAKVS